MSVIPETIFIRWDKLCPDEMNQTKKTNGSKVIIQFHSDMSDSDKGLIVNITWKNCKLVFVLFH